MEDSRFGAASLYTGYDSASGWRVSSEQSATRALAILACFQVLLVSICTTCRQRTTQVIYPSSNLNQDVEVVSALYVASLGDLV